MQHIDSAEINTSLPARIAYLQSFLDFDPDTDGQLIHACQPVLGPVVNDIVDAVYDHLLKYDITASAFAPAQTEHQSSVRVDEIHRDHANIRVRKDFLKGYLIRLASNTDYSPTSKFWTYLDRVGKAHTGGGFGSSGEQKGLHRSKEQNSHSNSNSNNKNRPPLFVEYREINLLLAWCENAVIELVVTADSLDLASKLKTIKALNCYWWIQNDLFARHYISQPPRPSGAVEGAEGASAVVQASDDSGSGIWAMLGWGGKEARS